MQCRLCGQTIPDDSRESPTLWPISGGEARVRMWFRYTDREAWLEALSAERQATRRALGYPELTPGILIEKALIDDRRRWIVLGLLGAFVGGIWGAMVGLPRWWLQVAFLSLGAAGTIAISVSLRRVRRHREAQSMGTERSAKRWKRSWR